MIMLSGKDGVADADSLIEAAEVLIKYQGYIDRERMIADKIHRLEAIQFRAVLLTSGHFLREDFLASGSLQRFQLHIQMLFLGGLHKGSG